MTNIYFAGGETPDHRKRLIQAEVGHIAINWSGLRKRLPKTKEWRLEDKFPEDTKLLIEAGMTGKAMDPEEIKDLADEYYAWVEKNSDRIEIAIEFDHPAAADIEGLDEMYPVWNKSRFADLDQLVAEYGCVAVTPDTMDERYTGKINSYTYAKGVKVHGLGITRPSQMEAVRFSSVSSTSWVSPMRFGDRIIWDGKKLHRYPKRYKETALKEQRLVLEKNGFDAEAIAMDDPSEVVRLSIWSWQQYEAHLNRSRLRAVPEADIVTIERSEDEGANGQNTLPEVATNPLAVHNEMQRQEGRQVPLPVLGFKQITKTDEQGEVIGNELIATNAQRSLRICNTCRVSSNCPAFQPDNECAFGFPVEVRSREQLLSTMQALVEMQMARIGFGRFAEELEGGTADPAVSEEMDRFFRMVKTMRELSENRESLSINIDGRGEAGVLSRIFGVRPQEEDRSVDQHKVAATFNDIMDAEVIEEGEVE